MATAQERGYDFEEFTQEVLFNLRQYHKAAYHRFYDTKSTAGGILPGQPGDFLLVLSGTPVFIECKNSVVEGGMSRKYITSSVDEEQAAKMWVFIRAGGHGIYLFRSESADKIEAWPGEYIREVKVTPKMKPDPSMRISVFPAKKDLLTEFFLERYKK